MIIYLPKIPKYFVYPLLIMIVSIPFVIVNFVYGINTIPFHLIGIGSVIGFQIYMSRRSFNTCGTCGHERHMHDKKDLLKRKHSRLTRIVCDNYRKGKTLDRNYQNKYWNGEDTIEKWDTMRDR